MKKVVEVITRVFFFLTIFALGASIYFLHIRINRLEDNLQTKSLKNLSESSEELRLKEEMADKPSVSDHCGIQCEEKITNLVSQAVATLSAAMTKTVTPAAKPTSSVQTSYISLGTTFVTTSTSWVDVEDSSIYLDLENDYGKEAKISWEASLKVAHGNGKAFARLYDDTNKIAVDFSELSAENNVNYQRVSSSNLPFWRGRNLYKVQVKSLNSFEVTYSGGRIKVSY